jgi:hypothetical protein
MANSSSRSNIRPRLIVPYPGSAAVDGFAGAQCMGAFTGCVGSVVAEGSAQRRTDPSTLNWRTYSPPPLAKPWQLVPGPSSWITPAWANSPTPPWVAKLLAI